MTITTDKITRQYSMTPKGQFMETVKCNGVTVMRSTPDAQLFLSWMVREEMRSRTSQWHDQALLEIIRSWWEGRQNGFRGSFNMGHYQLVIKAKREAVNKQPHGVH